MGLRYANQTIFLDLTLQSNYFVKNFCPQLMVAGLTGQPGMNAASCVRAVYNSVNVPVQSLNLPMVVTGAQKLMKEMNPRPG